MIKDLCFEIIQKCPNNCEFCSSNSSYDCNNIIDLDAFKKTIDFFCEHGGIKEISLSGGEPLLHPNIEQIVKYCKERNIYVTLYTSGIVENTIDKNNVDYKYKKIFDQITSQKFSSIPFSMLKKLKNIGLNKIVFDMQASEVDEYNKLMGTKNNFIHLLDSMRYACNAELETSVHFVPNKINVNQFKDVYEIAQLAGINEVRLLKFVPQGRGKTNRETLELNDEELISFIEACKRIKQEGAMLKIGIPLKDNNSHLCTAGFDKIVIRYDGIVLPCPAFKDVDSNWLEKRGFKRISIYDNLEEFKFIKGVRKQPLCATIKR